LKSGDAGIVEMFNTNRFPSRERVLTVCVFSQLAT
jgi:hypothetical protein